MKRTVVNPIIKDTATFLQTAEETDGKLTEIEITLMPGGGNPLHYHKTYSETFTAIDGDLGVNLGKNTSKILKPGESFTLMFPLLKMVAKRAKANGEEQRLIDKYCV